MANLKVSEDLVSENNLEILPHIGTILTYAGTTAPAGWLLCNGGIQLKSTAPVLAQRLGFIGSFTPYSSNITASSPVIGIPGTSENLISYTVSNSSGFQVGDYVSVTGVTPSGLNTSIAQIYETRAGNRIGLAYSSNITLTWTSGGTITKVDGFSLPDLRERYLIGKGSSNLALNTNTGSNNHTHTYSYAGFTSDYTFPVSQTHSHNIGTYFNATPVSHYHYANVEPSISGFGNTAATFRAGSSQNMTTQNHAHSTGANGGNTNYNSLDQNHAHNGTITRNDASATTHNHTVSTSNAGTISSNTPINSPPTIYLNFIIKAG